MLIEAETKCVGLRSVDARKGFCRGGRDSACLRSQMRYRCCAMSHSKGREKRASSLDSTRLGAQHDGKQEWGKV